MYGKGALKKLKKSYENGEEEKPNPNCKVMIMKRRLRY